MIVEYFSQVAASDTYVIIIKELLKFFLWLLLNYEEPIFD